MEEERHIHEISEILGLTRCLWEEDLKEKYKINAVPVEAEEDAIRRINSIDEEANRRARTNPTDLNLYLQNEMEIVGRLAMLRSVGRAVLSGYVILTLEDVEKASEFYWRTVEPLKDAFARLPLSFNPRSVGEELRAYVLGIIREYGPITKSELARRSRLPSWLLDAVVDELIRSGDIRMEKVVKGKGRPVILYKIA